MIIALAHSQKPRNNRCERRVGLLDVVIEIKAT